MVIRHQAASQAMLARQPLQFRRFAVQEFCAKFYGRRLGVAQGVNATTTACARLKHHWWGPALRQFASRRQTCRAGPDDEHTISHGLSAFAVLRHRLVDLLEKLLRA